jgi:hypothetical protein
VTPIYDAANALDAQLVHDLLRDAGFEAHIFGAGLAGAVGELPPDGLVQIWVDETQAAAARQLVHDWQNADIPDEDELVRLSESQAAEGDLWA